MAGIQGNVTKMKRIVITGGTGFVGANLAQYVLREGHQVHLLVRPTYQPWRIEAIRTELTLHPVDLQDEEDLAKSLRKIRPDWVFHLAAHGAYSWETNLDQILQTNLIGTIHLLNACQKIGVETFIQTGTSSEYGFKKTAPDENERLEPDSDYAISKASATLYCQYQARKTGARIFTLRLYSVYGPYEDPRRFIPTLILHGMRNGYPPLANPSSAHDFVYVDDVCRAYLLAASAPNPKPGAIYNVGSGVQTTLLQATEVARRLMHIQGEPVWGSMSGRNWDTPYWLANTSKIQSEIGWIPQVPFEQGLQMTWDWFISKPEMVEFYLQSRNRLARLH
jgi:UDP-glucose 4-epimerase